MKITPLLSCILIGSLFGNSFAQQQTIAPVDSAVIKRSHDMASLAYDLVFTDLDSAQIVSENLLAYSQEKGYLLGEAQAYSMLSNVLSYQGLRGESMDLLKKSIAIYKELGDDMRVAVAHYNLASALFNEELLEDALAYFKLGLIYFEEVNNRSFILDSKSGIASVLLNLDGGMNEALELFLEVEQLAREDSLFFELATVLNDLGNYYLRYEPKPNTALRYYEEALQLVDPHDYFHLGYTYVGLGQAYNLLKQYPKSLVYNDSSIMVFEAMRNKMGLRTCYRTRVDLFDAMGDYKGKSEAYETFVLYQDSVFSEEQTQQLNALAALYKTEQKEAEITALSQQTAIQNLEIKQKNQGLMLGGALVIFVAVVVFLVLRQRDSKRKASQTELEHRFLRSQLNPHFIFNALVSVQTYLFKNDTEQAALYLTKFSKLMREILENSRQEFIPLEQEVSMLTNYLDLHRLRLDNQFTYDVVMDDSIHAEEETIPPMFVQPFVENAIEHGVLSLQAGGKIELVFKKQGGFIQIEVLDNGKGIESTQLKSTNHQSLATTIIRERMDLFNRSLRNKIQLAIGNRTDEAGNVLGTRVELMVPFQTEG